MLPQGPATRMNEAPTVETEPFLATFRAISAVFWAVFAPVGPLVPFWCTFGPVWSLFDPLSLVVSSPWWQALEFEAI